MKKAEVEAKTMNNLEIVKNFIKEFDHCVLATVSPRNMPECALVEFAETSELEIIFDTSTEYRKFINLERNQNVAFAIGSRDVNSAVQYEGVARRLEGGELVKSKEIFFEKCPDARMWEKSPDTVYYKVKPRWLRYRSYATEPMTEFEVNF